MTVLLIFGWAVLWIALGVLVWTRYLDLTKSDLLFTCLVAPLFGPVFLWLTWLWFAPDLSDEILIRKRK
jgi:hypothetical protein